MAADPFLDVDFPADPHYVPGDLTPDEFRAFANGEEFFGSHYPGYEDAYGTIPENEWRDRIAAIDEAGGGLDLLVNWIYNQRNEGSCVGNASSQATEIINSLQYGKDRSPKLSAISVYKRIGRSPNSGAMIDDAMEELKARGVLPLDTPENRAKYGDAVMPPTGFYTPFPANWEATAAKFKLLEALVIRSLEGMISALLRGHPVVVGRAGHSIVYVRPMFRNNALVVKYANSWGNWGENGFGYDSLSMVRSSSRWAFALVSTVVTE